MKLYELSTNYTQLVNMFENAEDNDSLEVIFDTLESLNDEIELKAESIAKIIKQFEADELALENESKRLKERASKVAKQKEQLETYLQNTMIKTGLEKFKTQLFNFSIRTNAPSVLVLNESEIPSEFFIVKQVEQLDKRAVAEVLKTGKIVEGCTLTRSRKLIIK